MTDSTMQTLFSSKSEMWETPQELFDKYNDIYHFDIDVCAIESNAKCEKYYSPEIDGLAQTWKGMCWCNPPYGRTVYNWVKKSYESWRDGGGGTTVVMLLPARTDTKWFHEFIYNQAEITFIKGRLHFNNSKSPAPFPSMIVVFNGDKIKGDIEL